MITTTLKDLRKAGACYNGYNKDAIWSMQASTCSKRDAHLFAVWCARQVEHLMDDERSKYALDVSEQFANGQATQEELDAAGDAAWYAAQDAAGVTAGYVARASVWDAARAAAWAAAWDAARAAAWDVARAASLAAWVAALDAAWDAARDAQKEMFIKMCNGQAPWQKGNVS